MHVEVDKGDEEQIVEAHGKEMVNGEVQGNSKDSGLLGSIKSLMRVCSMRNIKFWRCTSTNKCMEAKDKNISYILYQCIYTL